MVPMW